MARYKEVQAITFDYGQRHKVELEAAKKICEINNIPQKLVPFESFAVLGGNSLLDGDMDIESPDGEDGLPNTFVPGRNLIFLNLAAAWAYQLKTQNLVTGVCQTDFSGYPDCREDTMQALEKSIQLGMEADLKIITPLMHVDKGDSISMAQELGALESLAYSHTCYEGQVPPCGKCPSCILRAKGFEKIGMKDPLLERLEGEKASQAELQVCLNQRPLNCCADNGALKLLRELKKCDVADRVNLKPFTCLGMCKQGPAVKLIKEGKEHLLDTATVEKVQGFLDKHGL